MFSCLVVCFCMCVCEREGFSMDGRDWWLDGGIVGLGRGEGGNESRGEKGEGGRRERRKYENGMR